MASLGEERKKITSYILYTKQIFETIQVANFAILWSNQAAYLPIISNFFTSISYVCVATWWKTTKKFVTVKLSKRQNWFISRTCSTKTEFFLTKINLSSLFLPCTSVWTKINSRAMFHEKISSVFLLISKTSILPASWYVAQFEWRNS